MANERLDVPTTKVNQLKGHKGSVACVNFTAEGEFALSGGSDRSIRLWNPIKGTEIKQYNGHNKVVNDITASVDNSKIISASEDRTAILWDVATGRYARKITGHTMPVNCARLNKEVTVAFTASFDATVAIWDLRSNARDSIQTLSDAKDSITSLHVVDHEILTGSVDGHLRNYDLRMGQLRTDCVGAPITSVNFSSDQNCFLVSSLDGKIRLFDKTNGAMLNEFTGHKNKSYKIRSVLSRNDELVISGSEDGKVFFWDLVNGNIVHELKTSQSSAVTSISRHHKENRLLSCGANGIIDVWE